MVSRVKTVAFQGIEAVEIDVQVHLSPGLPSFNIVGLPDKAVAESRERVRSALHSIGLAAPAKRVTVNLAPADMQKEGSHFDLAIALGLLCEMQVVQQYMLDSYIAMGELALDGGLGPISGVIPAAIAASSSGRGVICPKYNGPEAMWAGEIEVLAPPHLLSIINHFKGSQFITPPVRPEPVNDTSPYPDLSGIVGQETAKRALEIAASGGHNILMVGPPGSGKSMLARALSGILPPLAPKEILEVSMIGSIAGTIREGRISGHRPFRDPHHSCSMAAMVGGGVRAKPGEVTLSHNGVLFLDELPEFPRQVLDSLRQPVENGEVTVSRANSHVTYPANFQLVAAMNPCRCGHLSDAAKACGKAPKCASDYQSRISGPLFDRIDMNIDVPAVEIKQIQAKQGTLEPSSKVAERVKKVRDMQTERYKDSNTRNNADLEGILLQKFCALDDECQELLVRAAQASGISMRSYNRTLKVARTIADMEGAGFIAKPHLAEAIGYNRRMVA